MNPRETRWKKSQIHEKAYYEEGLNVKWNVPHSLEYWRDFLRLDGVTGKGLEIGCGLNGLYKFDRDVLGIDPIDFSYVAPNFRLGIGEEVPLEDQSVDYVVCSNVLDHTANPEKVLREIFRVSSYLVLWTYVWPSWLASFMQRYDEVHPHHFTREEVYSMLDKFSVDYVKKVNYTFYTSHLQYVKYLPFRAKLVVAHLLGVRGLLLHVKRRDK